MDTPTDSPPILRPIPRRPFDLNLRDPTPPPDGDSPAPGTPYHNLRTRFGGLSPSSTFASEASTLTNNDSEPSTISRAASFLNLQQSTLFGIYQNSSQPSSPTPDDGTAGGSPWGTGAETPLVKRPGVSDAMFEIMRHRRSGDGRGSVDGQPGDIPVHEAPRPLWDALNVAFRVALLFGLGVGYGVLVGRLRSDPVKVRTEVQGWRHLLFWGVGGVVIAALLPWFDRVWEARVGRFAAAGARATKLRRMSDGEGRPPMDWSLVLRAMGTFLGIAFAIRKLAWTSTMQVSLYLAAVNPFLWYLIDRSKTGFLLSAAFSLTGSAVLMGLDPDLMPVPTTRSPLRNATRTYTADRSPALPSDETVETAVWMVSVLFCSCLCFGNIGRRMGLDRSAYARGRWAGVR